MPTTRDLYVSLDGSSDFNAPYGTGSWDDVGWINSLSLYDGSGADVYNAHVDLSGSDWTIRSMNIGSEGNATLYLNDLDDGSNRNIQALFINTNSVINLSTTNIRHIWGGGDSQELNLGSGRVGNIDLYAATNTINTGSGFIMGITTSGLSNIDVAEGCGIGSIFTDYGSEVHITLHDQSYVDYIQVCGSNSSIEFEGYVDVATVRLEGASIDVGDGYIGSILDYTGGGTVNIGGGNVTSIQVWREAETITAGTGSSIGSIMFYGSPESGVYIETDGDIESITSFGGNNFFQSGAGSVGTIGFINNGNDFISIGAGGASAVNAGSGNNTIVTADGYVNTLNANEGDDILSIGSGGAGAVNAGLGNNTITTADGWVNTISTAEGDDVVSIGNGGGQTVNVGPGNNILYTAEGLVKTISADDGDDIFSIGSGGAAQINAGSGNNIIYTSDGWVTSIAVYEGDDRITVGTGAAGAVMTWGGNDVIDLYGWVGSLQAGDGDDKITIESSMGWNGSPNMFSGGRGSDLFIVKPQDDTAGRMVIDGGSDGADNEHDTVDFSYYKTGLAVTLGGLDSTIQNTGAGYVSLIGVENIVGGSANDVVTDTATSNTIDNLFIGGAGNDSLSGGLGNDTLIGDTGKSSFSIASTSVKYVGGDYEQPTLIADVTGDGINDLVVTGRVFVVPGIVNGSLGTSYEIINNFGYQQTTKIGDVNGDGKLDLVTQNSVGWGSYVHVLLNNGTGGFSNAATYSTPSDGMAVVGDVNGDGFDDLITPDNAANQIEIRLSTGSSGILSEAITVDVGGVEGFAKVVDLDGNGTNEIFLLNPETGETLVVYYDGGSAEVYDGPNLGGDIGTFGLSLTGVDLVDLTNDGQLDGIVGRTDGSIDILENRADGTVYLLDSVQMASHAKVIQIQVADLNGDGIDDILALAGEPFDGSSTLSLFTGLGDGHFSSETVLDVRTGGGLFAVGDLNGDGVADITRTNWGSGNAVILYGSLAGIADADSLYGGDGNDALAGGGGADVLNGGAGNDSMAGGANDDTYTVDSSADVVTENQNEGIDTVQSSITYLVASNVENLTLTGSAAINGTGNTLSNILTGNSAANSISGGGGNDTLEGAAGNDSLTGGDGIDTASYAGGTAAVTVNLTLTSAQNTGGAGTDTLTTIENLIGSAYNDALTGDTNANSLSGGNGNDSLVGGAGNDTLDGGTGNDSLTGGAGDDTYVVDSSTDVVVELANGGTDFVQSSAASYTLTAEVENLTLTGSAAINGTGNTLSNILTGNSAANSISGGGGNDTIIGGAGNDTLEGAAGSDSLTGGDGVDTASYNGSAAAVTVNLSLTSAQNTVGAGTDTLTTIENLIGSAYNDTLTGDANANMLSGGTGNDSLIGGAGNDTITGDAGNDTLDGGAGNDSVSGGANDDTYIVDSSSDVVVELANGGTDLVQSSAASFTLTDNLENLTLTGSAAINGAGNLGNNVLTGNSGANSISGGGGNDTIIGGAGNDTLEGAAGNDSLTGGDGIDTASYNGSSAAITVNLATTTAQNTVGAGTDTLATIENLIGSAFNDTLTGDVNANVFSGGAGNDSLTGGAGNDTFSVGAGTDVIMDLSGNDIVTVVGGAAVNATVTAAWTATGGTTNAGAATLTTAGYAVNLAAVTGGSVGYKVTNTGAAAALSGSSWADTLTGGVGNDTLVGGGGNDTMEGAAGNDSLTGGDGVDTASYNGATAGVTVNLALTTAQNTVGAGTDTLATIENLMGSAFNDILTGDANANSLSGGLGNDSLTGGAGNDMLDGGAGNDTLDGGDGTDAASYASATAGVTVDLTLTTAQNTVGGGTDTLATFENLIGSNFNDLLTGAATVNQLEGGTGADTLVGGAGADVLYGGDGDDRFVIAAAADLATGEVITGGNGTDELRFTSTTASTLTLTSGVAVEKVVIGTGTAASADSSGVVALNVNAASAANGLSMLGNAGANTLTGTGYNDSIDGGSGNDSLTGGAGNDTVYGGLGNDTLVGGAGSDVFVFNTTPNASSNKDTISDFASANDDIWLSKTAMAGLGSSTGQLSSAAFWSGAGVTASHDADDRVIYNSTTGALYYDADGNGSTAAVQIAQLTANTVLTYQDFFII